MRKIVKPLMIAALSTTILSSCVSKKKYTELEGKYNNTRSELQKQQLENEKLEDRFDAIETRVDAYNMKIASLQESQDGMMVTTADGSIALSEKDKEKMRSTLKNIPPEKLSEASTLKDSLNLAISYNLSKKINGNTDGKMLNMKIDQSVIMIDIADNMLFKDGSYRIGNDADEILQQIADVVNSEKHLEIMVEGHTDNRTVKEGSYVKDNWDLSTERAAAVVRKLESKFNVAPEQLIVAGRGSYDPMVSNDNNDDRAKNRRTKIVIMPNLDKFFAMLAEDGTIEMEKDKM